MKNHCSEIAFVLDCSGKAMAATMSLDKNGGESVHDRESVNVTLGLERLWRGREIWRIEIGTLSSVSESPAALARCFTACFSGFHSYYPGCYAT